MLGQRRTGSGPWDCRLDRSEWAQHRSASQLFSPGADQAAAGFVGVSRRGTRTASARSAASSARYHLIRVRLPEHLNLDALSPGGIDRRHVKVRLRARRELCGVLPRHRVGDRGHKVALVVLVDFPARDVAILLRGVPRDQRFEAALLCDEAPRRIRSLARAHHRQNRRGVLLHDALQKWYCLFVTLRKALVETHGASSRVRPNLGITAFKIPYVGMGTNGGSVSVKSPSAGCEVSCTRA